MTLPYNCIASALIPVPLSEAPEFESISAEDAITLNGKTIISIDNTKITEMILNSLTFIIRSFQFNKSLLKYCKISIHILLLWHNLFKKIHETVGIIYSIELKIHILCVMPKQRIAGTQNAFLRFFVSVI